MAFRIATAAATLVKFNATFTPISFTSRRLIRPTVSILSSSRYFSSEPSSPSPAVSASPASPPPLSPVDEARSASASGFSAFNNGLAREALTHFDHALRLFNAMDKDAVAHCQEDLALVLGNWGEARRTLGLVDGTEDALRQSLNIWEKLRGDKSLEAALIHNNLGLFLSDSMRYKTAETHFKKAIAAREEILGKESQDVAISKNNLGLALCNSGKAKESIPIFRDALAVLEKILGADSSHPLLARVLNNVGHAYSYCDQRKEALEYFERALKALNKGATPPAGPEASLDHAHLFNNIALVLFKKGEHAEAEKYFNKALSAYEKVAGVESSYCVLVLTNLAACLKKAGKKAEAKACANRAQDIASKKKL